MKKKFWKTVALILALGLIGFLAWFANGFLGNPVSKALATRTAEEEIEVTYAGTDYYIERITFSFKDGCYHAFVKSPTSIDTEFSMIFDMLGRLRYDTYDSVLKKYTTASRLEWAYRELTDTVFESSIFPYPSDIGYGTLKISESQYINEENSHDLPEWSIHQETLVLDGEYDINALGAQAGELVVYIDTDELTIENFARILLGIRDEFNRAGICFYAIDLTLQYPRPEEGPRPDDYIGVSDFLYEDIYEEGLEDRVAEAFEELQDYYAEMDKIK